MMQQPGIDRRQGPTISLCMIVKNEERYLEGCLSSVEGCVDEIIVVDPGSTDQTVDIARRFGGLGCDQPTVLGTTGLQNRPRGVWWRC